MEKIKLFVKQNLLYIIGAILGAVAGYLYYAFIGCSSGSCPITSSPTISVIWGAVMGALILSIFKKTKPRNQK
ncbi:MAG: DUF6132 family protein [Rikenellaceae bacterium]